MKQALRWFVIVNFAELAAIGISVGIVDRAIIGIFAGLNFAFAAAVMIVLDHEARGKGK